MNGVLTLSVCIDVALHIKVFSHVMDREIHTVCRHLLNYVIVLFISYL